MNDDFSQVLAAQYRRYPLMQPQDFGKLAFQSEFGPEHMITDTGKSFSRILEEIPRAREEQASAELEWIGNGLCRFPLAALSDESVEAALLSRLMAATAVQHQGSKEGMERRLQQLRQLPVPGMEAWLQQYRGMGCPAVHHSDVFRRTYRPHYRLLLAEFALYFPVLSRLEQHMKSGKPIAVAIDGRCGSGKTSLAQLLRRIYRCNVFHMDDFYLPFSERKPDWPQSIAGNMDLARFAREVLEPLRNRQPVDYRRYHCPTGTYSSAQRMQPTELTVIEGSYSHHPALSGYYDCKVFLTCTPGEQQRRLRRREGDNFEGFEKYWIPMEERYFRTCRTQQNSDITVDTGIVPIAG